MPEAYTLKFQEVYRKIHSYSADIRRVVLQKYLDQILTLLYEKHLVVGTPNYLGLRILDNHKLPTITYNENTKSYIGLHIDSWDSTQIYTTNPKNRICVNLGSGIRFFYFINLSIEQINGLYESTNLKENNKKDLVSYFFKRETCYPVVRVALNPGEYYIAPTERIIHDANFLEQEDVTITIIGHFR